MINPFGVVVPRYVSVSEWALIGCVVSRLEILDPASRHGSKGAPGWLMASLLNTEIYIPCIHCRLYHGDIASSYKKGDSAQNARCLESIVSPPTT